VVVTDRHTDTHKPTAVKTYSLAFAGITVYMQGRINSQTAALITLLNTSRRLSPVILTSDYKRAAEPYAVLMWNRGRDIGQGCGDLIFVGLRLQAKCAGRLVEKLETVPALLSRLKVCRYRTHRHWLLH